MKRIEKLFTANAAIRQFSRYLAAIAMVGLLALGANGLLGSAKADSHRENREMEELRGLYQKAQLAELYELEQDFHLAASYGGDIDAMMALWTEDCIMTSGASVFSGKDAVRTAIAAGGPFHNYWVGLTPAFTITAEIHGHTADFSFQCAYVDLSVTPNVVRLNRGLSGTVKRVNGKWLLWHMDSHPATL